MILDLSALQPDPPPPSIRTRNGKRIAAEKAWVQHGHVVVRKPEDVTGITLHATGCYFGPSKAALRAGKTRDDAVHDRALNVHAHMTCFSTGVAVLAYPRLWHVYHGHAFCPDTIGQEHEGNWGPDGKPKGAPNGYDLSRVIDAGRAGIESHLEAFPNLRFIRLHRQTCGAKPACPGRVIFREVGLWAVEKHGMRVEPDRTWRDGTPIPREWFT